MSNQHNDLIAEQREENMTMTKEQDGVSIGWKQNKTMHTPTPWKIWSNDIVAKDSDGDDLIIAGIGKTASLRSCVYSEPVGKVKQANAQFIVTACNAHEDLVKALVTIECHGNANPLDRAIAREALAKAGVL